ncbi:MAG: PfkB family carbohydrate kinase [Syntrophomonadaceae bacterium]|jgi:pseudouridine kinase
MRLTLREKELFEALKRDPLIAQEELARRFGITRSSVAVHISNLMKKGVILGKGYVFNEAASTAIFGESCIKIEVKEDTSETNIDIKFSGFAIEMTKAMANFGLDVKLITAIGNDDVGDAIINLLKKMEIDTSNIYRYSDMRSCRKILVNKIPIYNESISWKEYEKVLTLREWVAFNSEWLCIDPNLYTNIYSKFNNKDADRIPNLSTYIVIRYPEEIPVCLGACSTLVMGVEEESLGYYLDKIKPLVLNRNWVITDGNNRVVFFKDQKAVDIPLMPYQGFSIEHRLPFLLAGLIYGLSNSYPLRQAIRIGIGSAAGE